LCGCTRTRRLSVGRAADPPRGHAPPKPALRPRVSSHSPTSRGRMVIRSAIGRGSQHSSPGARRVATYSPSRRPRKAPERRHRHTRPATADRGPPPRPAEPPPPRSADTPPNSTPPSAGLSAPARPDNRCRCPRTSPRPRRSRTRPLPAQPGTGRHRGCSRRPGPRRTLGRRRGGGCRPLASRAGLPAGSIRPTRPAPVDACSASYTAWVDSVPIIPRARSAIVSTLGVARRLGRRSDHRQPRGGDPQPARPQFTRQLFEFDHHVSSNMRRGAADRHTQYRCNAGLNQELSRSKNG